MTRSLASAHRVHPDVKRGRCGWQEQVKSCASRRRPAVRTWVKGVGQEGRRTRRVDPGNSRTGMAPVFLLFLGPRTGREVRLSEERGAVLPQQRISRLTRDQHD